MYFSSPDSFNNQTAVYVGSPGNKYFQQYDFLPLIAKTEGDMQRFAKQLFEEVHPCGYCEFCLIMS